MPFIKKLVIKGFKSFPRETDLLLDRTMNVIVGPNGSGKSNVTDAICFVLGRLSIKSMRAAKAANLIFAGTKMYKPANEASVEIVFDNSDKSFAIPETEINLKRIVRRNGQGIYKINNHVKTRQEIIELLAQAGIDPHGFNIILQGEISSFVKMHAEERRKIIEEVAGISIYEIRKQKSLKELEKTDERLKQVSAVLRERTAYLKNLEEERQQALKFKKLEETVKRCKASIFKKRVDDRNIEKNKVEDEISKQRNDLDKVKILIGKLQEEIKSNNNQIDEINNQIQRASGIQQTSLSREVTELKEQIAGLSVRKENYQSQIEEIERRNQELQRNIDNSEQEIKEMRKTKGKSRKQDFENKKQQLEEFEEKRRKFYSLKSQVELIDERLNDKKTELARIKQEASFNFGKMQDAEQELSFKVSIEEHTKTLESLNKNLQENKNSLNNSEKILLDAEKSIYVSEMQIKELEKIKKQVSDIDICPLCKTKITTEHIGHIEKEANEKISELKSKVQDFEKKKNKAWEAKENTIIKIREEEKEIEQRNKDIMILRVLQEKKQSLRRLEAEEKKIQQEIQEIEQKKKNLEKTTSQLKNLEQDYDSLKLEVQELARHEETDVGMEITMKQRELDRMRLIIKQSSREKSELEQEIEEISKDLEEKEGGAEEKEKQQQVLQEKYRKKLQDKTRLQDRIRLFESDMLKKQNDERLIENEINNFKIKIAEINAQIEGINEEAREFQGVEIIKASVEILQDKLQKTQQILATIGTVNLRALEVYDDIKKQYDSVAEKVEQLNKEKQEILKIVEEIDKKKKKVFHKTLEEINALFSRNFSQLSSKGEAFLEPENQEDTFAAGLDIIIKVARGKYFDVTSLSGGEQTLIALALIFAIQEYRPYSFYIFDEIDAALDKRNSERLSILLKKHMKAGQYIIITHNDALISEATTLYGVSMQEGISKILSLQI